MSQYLRLPWAAALSAIAAFNVLAQTTSPAAVDASQASPVRLAPYRSTLESYQPFLAEKLRPWKQANETVEVIGGWRAYAKEASEPESVK